MKFSLAHNNRVAAACLLLMVLFGTGCHSIGPHFIARDRYDYSASISDSWKRQTLLNIVKMRYFDPPIFVDVGQIVSGYQFQTAGNLGGQVSSANAVQGNTLMMGGAATFIDRPTITYTPLTGNKFIKGLMTPLSPESVFFTIQSGWPADGVLFATLASINGLKNQESSISGVTPPDPEFMRVLALMRRIQLSGAVAMRIKQTPQQQETALLTFRSKDILPETLADIRELRRLLRLDPDAENFNLVFGTSPTNDKEVAVVTRSLLQQMTTMASQVNTPAEDVTQGRATPGWETVRGDTNAVRLIQIQSARNAPADAFVAINYRGLWYWIDDRDLKSKRAFAFMLVLFTLADTGEKEGLPLITIPAQ